MPNLAPPSSVPLCINEGRRKRLPTHNSLAAEEGQGGAASSPPTARAPSGAHAAPGDEHGLEDTFEDCIEAEDVADEEEERRKAVSRIPLLYPKDCREEREREALAAKADADNGLQQALQQGIDSGFDSITEFVRREQQLNEEDAVQRTQAEELDADGPVLQSSDARNNPMQNKVNPADFEMLRVVGQGAFGKVLQVRHKATGAIHAMKIMKKERILQKDHGEYVRSERDVLTSVVHPYIVNLRCSFQTQTKLYLVLEFINGGHLFFNLYRQGVFDEAVARLYTAEIVSAIGYLHSIGIMHRDLKPENVLLDSEGHVKLTDFGLAKSNMGDESARTNSFIGTMEYMAPEIIAGKGHTKDVDWWSTGILLYEMLCGVPPFRAKSRNSLQTQIMSSKVKYPKFLSSDALNLLKALLTRDPSKRLGAGLQDAEAVRRHPFFKTINWGKLERRELDSKFKPAVTSCTCTANFDKLWTDQLPVDSPSNSPITGDPCGDLFKGFTYVAPGLLDSAVSEAVLLEKSASGSRGRKGCSESGEEQHHGSQGGTDAAELAGSQGAQADGDGHSYKRSCSTPVSLSAAQPQSQPPPPPPQQQQQQRSGESGQPEAAGAAAAPAAAPSSQAAEPGLPQKAQAPQQAPPPHQPRPQAPKMHFAPKAPKAQQPPRPPQQQPQHSNGSIAGGAKGSPPHPPQPRRQTGFAPPAVPSPRDPPAPRPIQRIPSHLTLQQQQQQMQQQQQQAQQSPSLSAGAAPFVPRS